MKLLTLVALLTAAPFLLGGAARSAEGQPVAVAVGSLACAPVWRRVPTPAVGLGWLNAVASDSPTDAWAVGTRLRERDTALLEHWNGKNWRVTAGPRFDHTFLAAVAASSPSDAWAVGGVKSAAGASQALVEHWDGRR